MAVIDLFFFNLVPRPSHLPGDETLGKRWFIVKSVFVLVPAENDAKL